MSKAPAAIKQPPDLLFMLLLVLLVPVVYFKVFSAGFISWDDKEVLVSNLDVHHFNIKAFFTKHYVGNYAPVSMISFAIDWMLFKGQAGWQHAISLLYHVVNSILVFRLVKPLLNDSWKAFFVSVVFCFHPTQVETVAWVAAKNSMVYVLFFLLALIAYVHYKKENRRNAYLVSLVLFCVSALSKPSAICFPLCLFAIDFMLGEKPTRSSIIKKLPFFAVSLVIGIVTLYARAEDKFINETHNFAFYERIGYAGYALGFYVLKFLAPLKLSVIYPYPQHKALALIGGTMVLMAIILLLVISWRKKHWWTLGAGLFILFNFILVLQFVPFGEVIAADRYMYVPLVGFALLVVSLLKFTTNQWKYLSLGLLIVYGSLTFFRAGVWKNSIGLYSDILDKYPDSFVALNSLGAEYMLQGQTQNAYTYLDKAIANSPVYYKGYYNRGLLNAQVNRFNEALNDFTKAIELRQYVKAYVGRANVYYTLKDLPKAMADGEKALSIEPQNVRAKFLMANCYDDLNQLGKAKTYYDASIAQNPEEPLYHLRRAILYGKQQNFGACLDDLNICLQLNPSFSEAYYWRGVAKVNLQLNPSFSEAYYWRGVAKVNLQQNPCSDFKQAYQSGFTAAQGALARYCH